MFNTIAALGTIGLQVSIVVVVVGWIMRAPFVRIVAKHSGLLLAAIFSAATVLSFVYQYGFGFEPCLLCWYQRIAIIPVALLAWTANVRDSKLFQSQSLLLLVPGTLVALLHVYIDIFPTGLDLCGATGPSCLMRYVYEFGYITIPMMSLTVLLSGLTLVLLARNYPQQ